MIFDKLEKRNNISGINFGNYKSLDADIYSDSDAMRDSTYFKCIKIISESIGKVGCNLMKETEKGVIRDTNNPLYYLVKKRPNPYMSSLDFFKTIEAIRQHKGESFARSEEHTS